MKFRTSRLKRRFHRRSLVYQAAVIVFFGGLVVSSLISTGQLFYEYRYDQKMALREIDDLVRVFQPQLESSVWHLDKNSIRRIVESLARDRSIASAEVSDTGFEAMLSASSLKESDWTTLTYTLGYYDKGSIHKIGTLRISLTKGEFLENFKAKMLSVIIQNILSFLGLTAIIAWFFHQKISLRVFRIQEMTHRYSKAQLKSIVGFSIPTHYGTQNELDILQWDIEQLQTNFQSAFELQKKSEQQILQTQIQLNKEQQKIKMMQRLDSIGQITAQVVHDFGNLMMIIQGKTTILDRHLKEDSQKKYTQDIRKALIRAQTLVAKLLHLTRFQENEKKVLSPLQMIHDMRDLLKTAVGSQIELLIPDLSSENMLSLKTEVDSSSFENALLNLCVNARDAMPDGGEIRIQVCHRQKKGADFVEIAVTDTGCGIPQDIQDKIFEPFFTTKAVGKGSGLGLHQVQEFVKDAGGWLDLSSSPSGTTFTLHLPEHQANQQQAA
jgi:signal transduction histidine kinase